MTLIGANGREHFLLTDLIFFLVWDEHLIMVVSEHENKLKQLSKEVVFVFVASLAGWFSRKLT